MAYEYNISPDKSSIHIIEHYPHSAAVVHHVTQMFLQFAAAFTALASVKGFVANGTPDPEARTIRDGFGAVCFNRFDGFTR